MKYVSSLTGRDDPFLDAESRFRNVEFWLIDQ